MFNRDLLERAWVVLMETARARETISYSELALSVGLPGRHRTIHRIVVTPICALVCHRNGYPDLASLVVRKDTGVPGEGWWTSTGGNLILDLWRDELNAVFEFDWPDELPL